MKKQIVLREPVPEDGLAVYELIKACPPLDLNSSYHYLIMCTHFSQTSVICDTGEGIRGFISGYIHPRKRDTLFVWQVAVDERVRGRGMGTDMLMNILKRACMRNVRFFETTVTPSNIPSRTLFHRAAERLDTQCVESPMFTCLHFGGTEHEQEDLLRIGPFILNK